MESYQHELFEKLKKSEKNFKKAPKERIIGSYLQTRLELLEDLWKEFKDGHKAIVLEYGGKKKESSYFTEDIYEQFEDIYTQYKTNLKEILQQFLTTTTSQPSFNPESFNIQKSNNEIKLPTIQLPTFSGRYEEWQTFYDLFCSLIHGNQTLTPVQKLYYLKSKLSGDPEALLRNFSTTDANYEEAWQLLVKRYNNKRYNCNAILKMLFSQKPVVNESAQLIKQLVDTTSTCLKSLDSMEVKTEIWDLIINYLIVSKLDPETMKQWEQHLSVNNWTLPTWPQLREFLETRFRSLEMIDNNKIRMQPKPVTKPKVFHSHLAKDSKKCDIKCALCSGDHYIFYCKKFAAMSTEDRQEFVKLNNLCFSCLAPTHAVIKCRQSACCKRCGRRHHSLLHFEREKISEAASASSDGKADTGILSETVRGFEDTHLMIFVGFGFLMTFLKKYCYSALGFNWFLAALVVQWALLCQSFYHMEENVIYITKKSILEADIMAATILISFGAVLGVASGLQLLFIGIVETAIACLNFWLVADKFKAADVGGSIAIHVFGAYFGLGVSWALRPKKEAANENASTVDLNGPSYTSDVTAMIGSIFLWICWPSFNSALTNSNSEYQRAVINTYLALASATVTSFVLSSFLSKHEGKFDMVHIQNSTLAGGVAVGSVCNMFIGAGGAIAIGIGAGIISVLGYRFLAPKLTQLGVLDTCGVNNLHGMPGLYSGLLTVLFAALATSKEYGTELKDVFSAMSEDGTGRTSGNQALNQFLALVVTLGISTVGGVITGLIARIPVFDGLKDSEKYDDEVNWELP